MFLCPEPTTVKIKGGYYNFEPNKKPKIETKITPLLSQKESYRLEVDEGGVHIEGADEKGVYYGKVTLYQLMANYRGCLPYIYIYDEPMYHYRGFMIDSSRHFFTVPEIKKMIDGAVFFKLNKFHFHLSDDQGFRVKIDAYPLLTEIGSVRKSSNFNVEDDDNTPYGGYYTKEDLKEIVEYCKERYVEIIPEFDIPGHTTAVIASYPEVSCRNEKIDLKTTQGVFEDILCVGNPETFRLVHKVIDELCEIFPGKFFHIGGDEVPKDRWNKCPKCQAKREELGLKTMEELQGWFVNEISLYLKKKGKRAICWNEAIRGNNVDHDNVVVSWWSDKTDVALKWANGGNPTIVESLNPYYMDFPYGLHSLKKVYTYNPQKIKGLTDLGRSSIVGLESPVWTEHITNFEKMSKMCFPRWAAFADTAWKGNENKDYQKFIKSVQFFCEILKENGIPTMDSDQWSSNPTGRISKTIEYGKNLLTKSRIRGFFHKED